MRFDRFGLSGQQAWASLSSTQDDAGQVHAARDRDAVGADCSGCGVPREKSRQCVHNGQASAFCEVTIEMCIGGRCRPIKVRTVPEACPGCVAAGRL